MTAESHKNDLPGSAERHRRRHSPSRELLRDDEYLSRLAGTEVGADLTRGDYIILGVLGVLVPALLLVWGWF